MKLLPKSLKSQTLAVGLVAGLLSLAANCYPPPTQPSFPDLSCIGENNCNANGGGGGGTGPGAPAACQSVSSVQVKIDGEGTRTVLAVGENVRLDATAYNQQGDQITVICGVTWTNSNTSACRLLETGESYNPRLQALAPGLCRLTAKVGNGEGVREFVVQ